MVFVDNGIELNRKKLDELKIGPYRIIKRISNSMFKLHTGYNKSESNIFHISKLTSILPLDKTIELDD